ncbi:hypothetical protein [Sphingomonas sp. dw_22]|uniref:hypothetical protein n=1 Tax=Sphingomonas sp. dw_22 TaxID=2721175 RepID=UPI001BD20B9B|nr:hypothetical protein [Sphingomonas sp. dw_22]
MTAPFRIENQDKLRSTPATVNEEFKDYLGRLLKMIPAEVVGVYMIGAGIIPQTERVVSAIWAVWDWSFWSGFTEQETRTKRSPLNLCPC